MYGVCVVTNKTCWRSSLRGMLMLLAERLTVASPLSVFTAEMLTVFVDKGAEANTNNSTEAKAVVSHVFISFP